MRNEAKVICHPLRSSRRGTPVRRRAALVRARDHCGGAANREKSTQAAANVKCGFCAKVGFGFQCSGVTDRAEHERTAGAQLDDLKFGRAQGLAVEQVGHGRHGVELEFHAPSPSVMGFLEFWFTRREWGRRRGTERGDSR